MKDENVETKQQQTDLCADVRPVLDGSSAGLHPVCWKQFGCRGSEEACKNCRRLQIQVSILFLFLVVSEYSGMDFVFRIY